MKRLTLTYGVAPGSLRTVSLPMRRVNLLLGLFAGMTVWTLATAGVLVARLLAKPQGVTANLGASAEARDEPKVAAVTKNAAAPSEEIRASSEAKTAASAAAHYDTAALPPSANIADVARAQPLLTAEGSAKELADPTAASAQPAANALPAALSDVRIRRVGNDLHVHFAIDNLGPEVLRGHATVVAMFASKTGELITLRAPLGGLPFKARIRTTKDLTIYAPAAGKFTGAQIVIDAAHAAGQLVRSFDVESGAR